MSSTSTSAAPRYTDFATGGSADADEMGMKPTVPPLADPPAPICALPECEAPASRGIGKAWNRCCCAEHGRLIAHRAYAAKYGKIDIGTLRTLAAWGFYREDIGRIFGVSTGAVCDAAKRHGIEIAYADARARDGLPAAKWIKKDPLLIEGYRSGLALREIARRIGETVGAVSGRLNRLDLIGERKTPKPKTPRVELPDLGGCMFSVDVGFCGEPVEGAKPYCGKHAAICYRPSAPVDMRIAG